MKQLIWVGIALVVVSGAARFAWLMIDARQIEARREALREEFALASNGELAQLERLVGFSRLTSRGYPQVSDDGALGSPTHWRASVHHGARQAAMSPGARGIVVETSDDGQNRMARIQFDLPDAIRAERWDEVVWVAFVYRSRREGEYEYLGERSEQGGESAPIAVERVDVRLVTWTDGRLAARGTVGAIPHGKIVRHRPYFFDVRDATLLALVNEVFEASMEAPTAESRAAYSWNRECIVDRLSDEPADTAMLNAHQDCLNGATPACLADCHSGVGASCAEAAYALDHAEDPSSQSLYEEGCMYGYLNACTNHAAFLALRAEDDAAQSCARRVFENTCRGDDAFGCGMLGQMRASGAGFDEADPSAAYELLKRSCRTLGAFACSVLGRLGAAGVLGEEAAFESPAALARACETGYSRACPLVDAGSTRPDDN